MTNKALGMFKGFWNFKQFGNHLMPNTLILEGKSLKEITKWQKYYNYDHCIWNYIHDIIYYRYYFQQQKISTILNNVW
jgi:hypothetical protein